MGVGVGRARLGVRRGPVSSAAAVAVLIAVMAMVGGCATSRTVSSPPPARSTVTASFPALKPSPTARWLSYHGDNARTGAVPASGNLSSAKLAWSAKLGGAVFGQPLIIGSRVYVATETNVVYGLDSYTGAVAWKTSIGKPLTNVDATAGCGNIDPLGITSTPVIDPTTHTIYVVGEVNDGQGRVHHELVGLDLSSGAIHLSVRVDPPLGSGQRAVNLLQRASLALANGRVYIGFGGNSGDCAKYHGWLVGVRTSGTPRLVSFEVAADGEGGAIWQGGGAPAIDSNGNVYVTTGNANPDPPRGGPDPKKYTESLVKLSRDLVPLASFKDRVAGGDEDLSTGNPVLLPGGLVFATGKTDIAYLLRQSDLSLVAAIHGECGSNPNGGSAFDRMTDVLFVPCRGGGIQEILLATRTLGPRLRGANSAPILIGATLWAASYSDGTLFEYDATTGATLQRVAVRATLPHFVSPSTANGRLYLGTSQGILSFVGT